MACPSWPRRTKTPSQRRVCSPSKSPRTAMRRGGPGSWFTGGARTRRGRRGGAGAAGEGAESHHRQRQAQRIAEAGADGGALHLKQRDEDEVGYDRYDESGEGDDGVDQGPGAAEEVGGEDLRAGEGDRARQEEDEGQHGVIEG